MRTDEQGRSLYYFHAYATQDRYHLSMLKKPQVFQIILIIAIGQWQVNHESFCHSSSTLIFERFWRCSPEHLDHPMSPDMSQRSRVLAYIFNTLSMLLSMLCLQYFLKRVHRTKTNHCSIDHNMIMCNCSWAIILAFLSLNPLVFTSRTKTN